MDVLTWIIELAVGIGCLAGGALVVTNPRLRIAGIVLIVAGAAAAVHAVVALAR